jgi:hypothetical protein
VIEGIISQLLLETRRFEVVYQLLEFEAWIAVPRLRIRNRIMAAGLGAYASLLNFRHKDLH